MDPTAAIAAVLAVPASWFGGLLFDRIPDDEPVLADPPGLRLRGPYLGLLVTMVVVFVLTALRFADEGWGEVLVHLAAFGTLVTLSFIDLDTLRLPDRIVAPLLALSIPAVTIVSVMQNDAASIRYALLGGALYFGFLLLAHLAFPRGMGFGDVKLAAVLGLYLGWQASSVVTTIQLVLYGAVIGFVVGAMVGLVVFAFRRRSAAIPFGPFLAFGAIVAVLASSTLLGP